MPHSAALALGSEVLFDGEWCSVTAFDGPSVRLRSADGRALVLLASELLATAGCRVAGTAGAELQPGLSAALTIADGLPESLRARANGMLADLLDARTGFRSGRAEEPLPGEPRPAYDLATTTMTARMAAKVPSSESPPARSTSGGPATRRPASWAF